MDSSQAWIEALADLRAKGEPCAMAVVTCVKGSTPREVGARMIIAKGGVVWGTIGGGQLERIALETALCALPDERPTAQSIEIPLAEAAGQCCGGQVTLLIETFPWRPRRVVIFGAGHVGQALAGLGPWMRAQVQVIDPRDVHDLVPAPLPEHDWELLTSNDPPSEVALLPADGAVLVMTHSHALDLDILSAALARKAFPYLGLIGSERKWKRFQARLLERGHTKESIATITCPIGVSVGCKEPSSIALSVAAQLVERFALQRATHPSQNPARG